MPLTAANHSEKCVHLNISSSFDISKHVRDIVASLHQIINAGVNER